MKQLDPKAFWLFFLNSLMSVLVLIGVVFYVSFMYEIDSGERLSSTSFMWWTITFSAFLIVLSYVVARLSYHFYRYELVEDSFRKELGFIYKKYVTIPYDKIQNVNIHRSLLARFLGLSRLCIHTAGVGGVAAPEGSLPGLSKEVAEQLRDELIQRARNSRSGQGL